MGFGIVTGGSIMVPALGMTLMYGSSRFLNFAYGDFMTLAAFITISFASFLPLPVAIVLGVVALACFGPLVQRVVFAPLTGRNSLVLLVTSLGLSFVILNCIRAIWGTESRTLSTPKSLTHGMSVGPFLVTPLELIILVSALVISGLVTLLLYKTDLGIKIRATAESPGLAQTSGVAVGQLRTATWALASGLAGLGGILFALRVAFTSDFGFSLLLTVAAAIIVGGLGSPVGAVVGALVIGILSEVSTEWIDPSLKSGVAFVALAVMMLVRPHGLFGRAEA
ncbi:MAG TPA: branched-chain amino acid ABC transporter permease [Nocardioidaceae bacterium]|nr:branched-chain amino acid ABC transporter permease [Nocardioidaceae bacterium]